MAGIIYRGSPEHDAHLEGVKMEKELAAKPEEKTAVVPPRKEPVKTEETKTEKK